MLDAPDAVAGEGGPGRELLGQRAEVRPPVLAGKGFGGFGGFAEALEEGWGEGVGDDAVAFGLEGVEERVLALGSRLGGFGRVGCMRRAGWCC